MVRFVIPNHNQLVLAALQRDLGTRSLPLLVFNVTTGNDTDTEASSRISSPSPPPPPPPNSTGNSSCQLDIQGPTAALLQSNKTINYVPEWVLVIFSAYFREKISKITRRLCLKVSRTSVVCPSPHDTRLNSSQSCEDDTANNSGCSSSQDNHVDSSSSPVLASHTLNSTRLSLAKCCFEDTNNVPNIGASVATSSSGAGSSCSSTEMIVSGAEDEEEEEEDDDEDDEDDIVVDEFDDIESLYSPIPIKVTGVSYYVMKCVIQLMAKGSVEVSLTRSSDIKSALSFLGITCYTVQDVEDKEVRRSKMTSSHTKPSRVFRSKSVSHMMFPIRESIEADS